jgi:5-methylcytosine-specific restriction endonuclease McrA
MPVLKRLCPGCRVALIASPARYCPSCARKATSYGHQGKTTAERGLGHDFAKKRRLVMVRDGWRCQLCGGLVAPSEAHVDHIVPRAQGGTASLANLRLTHASCNLQRGTRP